MHQEFLLISSPIYNKGFAPDVRITSTAEDFAAKRDKAMEKGLEIIRENCK